MSNLKGQINKFIPAQERYENNFISSFLIILHHNGSLQCFSANERRYSKCLSEIC